MSSRSPSPLASSDDSKEVDNSLTDSHDHRVDEWVVALSQSSRSSSGEDSDGGQSTDAASVKGCHLSSDSEDIMPDDEHLFPEADSSSEAGRSTKADDESAASVDFSAPRSSNVEKRSKTQTATTDGASVVGDTLVVFTVDPSESAEETMSGLCEFATHLKDPDEMMTSWVVSTARRLEELRKSKLSSVIDVFARDTSFAILRRRGRDGNWEDDYSHSSEQNLHFIWSGDMSAKWKDSVLGPPPLDSYQMSGGWAARGDEQEEGV
ncbi:hypothetical protein BCR39DRAFT_561163 [Naematelia encephala]|uniref:Uncharacterized protein n=1 Tax=Naematelia encephala TaxID=71784 RepID=A0A1Y2ASI3_9TREE|nr:hypothetical protein BCR39DRAFT_561163 [Naematelia encephala]